MEDVQCKRQEVFCNWKVLAILIGLLILIGVIICLAVGNEGVNLTKQKMSEKNGEEDGREGDPEIKPEKIEVEEV